MIPSAHWRAVRTACKPRASGDDPKSLETLNATLT